MSEDSLRFSPNHDESARQAFVGLLKGYANIGLLQGLEAKYDEDIVSAFISREKRPPEKREDVESEIADLDLYKFWSVLTYHSQDMLFDAVGDTVRRTREEQEKVARALTTRPEKKGSLHLDPALAISDPIGAVEIHRQPGGYIAAENDSDLTAARLYSGTIELYRKAKGMGDTGDAGNDAIGQFTASIFRKYFPDKNPACIVDLGCGTGEQTTAFKRAFPEAHVMGIDVSAPFLRYGHAWAEQCGLAIAFHQMNAEDLRLEADSVDLIVTHILLHETSEEILPKIMAEALRVLRPGGVFLNLDVPYQPDVTPLLRQVTNNWQVRHNGEPFWTGFASTDLRARLLEAGFDRDKIFHNYEKFGAAPYLVFGAEK